MKKNDQIVESIVKKLGEEGIEYIETHGELPAVKLTNEEMSYIQGAGGLDKVIEEILSLGKTIRNPFA